MDDLLREYLPIIIFLGLAIALGLAFLVAALVLAVLPPAPEKISAYKGGLNALPPPGGGLVGALVGPFSLVYVADRPLRISFVALIIALTIVTAFNFRGPIP